MLHRMMVSVVGVILAGSIPDGTHSGGYPHPCHRDDEFLTVMRRAAGL